MCLWLGPRGLSIDGGEASRCTLRSKMKMEVNVLKYKGYTICAKSEAHLNKTTRSHQVYTINSLKSSPVVRDRPSHGVFHTIYKYDIGVGLSQYDATFIVCFAYIYERCTTSKRRVGDTNVAALPAALSPSADTTMGVRFPLPRGFFHSPQAHS